MNNNLFTDRLDVLLAHLSSSGDSSSANEIIEKKIEKLVKPLNMRAI